MIGRALSTGCFETRLGNLVGEWSREVDIDDGNMEDELCMKTGRSR